MPLFEAYSMKSDDHRLAHSKKPAYRQQMAEWQGGRDWITGAKLSRPCIDHDHDTGFCRLVLSQSTNTLEGRLRAILSAADIPRCDWAATVFEASLNSAGEIYDAFYDAVIEIFRYRSDDDVQRYLLRFGVYYAAAWGEMGHLIHTPPPGYKK